MRTCTRAVECVGLGGTGPSASASSAGEECPHRLDSGRAPARWNPRPARRPSPRAGAAAGPGRGDPRLPRREGLGHRRPPRTQSRCRRADHRAAPRVPVAGRHDHLGHGPPGLRPQDPDGPSARLRPAPSAGRPFGVSESHRERPRPGGELTRIDSTVVRRRARQGVGAEGPSRPAPCRRGHRRRGAHRGHGLGGAEQHRRLRPPARHRRERQCSLVLADDRWPGPPSVDPAHDPRLRAVHELGQEGAAPDSRGGGPHLRGAPWNEEGRQGRRGATGALRGSRPQVHRTG